ncbi:MULTISPECIES: 4-oxalomesaconate tautomerase [unclassified Luteimonas]
MQCAIPSLIMRGGTSRGPFFLESDLPADTGVRDRVLLAALGSPHQRQIDGLGGGHPLTSKIGIVRAGTAPGIDVEFLFAQLQPDADTVDTRPNCGNMLAAVVPFALETGLCAAQGDTTTLRVLTRNTGMVCEITVCTPGGRVSYEGDTRIDGVPGTGAPVRIDFLDVAGSVCPSLLPTGNVRDRIQVEGPGVEPFEVEYTGIDNGMPLVIVRAADFGIDGHETPQQLNADVALKARLEALRLAVSPGLGLGDVSARNYPKMTLVSAPTAGGSISTRSFIPHVCHDAVGVLAAVTVATAAVLEGSIAHEVARVGEGRLRQVEVEHPSGRFAVELGLDAERGGNVVRAGLLRTARLIMRGELMIPASAWSEHTQ